MREARRSGVERLILRGTLITLKRKCGKPTCHCAQHEPHATPALTYSVGGGKKMLTLRPEDVPTVEAALARYRKAQAELNDRALRGVTTLRAHIESRKTAGRAGLR